MSLRATCPELLDQRIAENVNAQEINLVEWIFERLEVQPEDHVLELCAGTGAQTLRFAELLGHSGKILALDISVDALNALSSKSTPSQRTKLELIRSDVGELSQALRHSPSAKTGFDLMFCAYGLYYSQDAERLLNEARNWLKPGGRIAIAGPFGLNNRQLFELVRASGAAIAEVVIDSSQRFMFKTVLPWAATNFESVSVHTVVNHVRWATAEKVLNYWQNSTFYDPEKRMAFQSLLNRHFAQHSEFVNEKWVMMVEMKRARS